MLRGLAGLVAAVAVVALGAPAPAAHSGHPLTTRATDPSYVARLFGAEVRRMPTSRPVVALTFNAAWDETGLDTVLDVLRRRNVPATFFLTGEFAERHPGAARAMAAEHGIGNHSYSHPLFDRLTRAEAAAEVLRADRAIRTATGAVPLPFFRFPFSATTPRGIADVNALGFADIEFTADTNGYLGTARSMSVEKAVARAVDALRPGEIVQMHVGADGDVPGLDAEALPRVDAVRARGYRITDPRTLLGTAPPS
ncbi:polysaccharide deacetylase family protein [Streptomyces sp. ISL-11]|uniref:polysaccharide deacetylase family protein n=1 Tax=Streptomyces sp. ISL-11 TaxID=2819174 RepID=UPI001BE58419|nr:polysaccharide deacetylase family protein [Streptomyces sp. ISL-11]MBT2386273.1 polysaccharide deacetylase family protein [Streptomyces sp. ISL-11]